MRPVSLLFLVFLLVPLAEIYVLIQVGGQVGALPTVALVVLTAVAGAALIRAQGLSTLTRAQQTLDGGELPAVELLEGAVLLVAGALLLTPGFITDSVGFALLVPPWRRHLITRFLAKRMAEGGPPGRPKDPPGGGRVIEGEYHREDRREPGGPS